MRNAVRAAPRTLALSTSEQGVRLVSVSGGNAAVDSVEAAAASMPMPMTFVRLGHSVLTRFQMKRENEVLTLTRRF